MKKFIFAIPALIILAAANSFAGRISDFNSLIDENTQLQNQLQKEITKSVAETKASVENEQTASTDKTEKSEVIVVENEPVPTVVKTKKNLLRFKKEVNFKKVRSQDNRLASEIKDAQEL